MGRINQLAEKTTLNSTDVIAVDAGAGGTTNKMTGANLAGQLKALGNYQDKLTFDTTPTAGSTNPVTSGGVKTALDGKQNTLTFDTTPTAGSTNPVTSGGVATAIQQSTATVHSVDVNGTSIVAYRVGNTVFFSCVGGTYECPSAGSYVRVAGSSTPLSQLPVGYRPVGYVDIRDSLAQKRLVMAPSNDASTGRFTGAEAFTSAALRFSATWVTADPMPT